jgi:hypothetical protein
MHIYGGGLAGMIAGCIFQTAQIFEAGPADQVAHKAVLRFRSTAVADMVGITFRPVTVHKAIWIDGRTVRPTPQLANWYSSKVIGRLADRSIWHTEPVERFIAPENFVDELRARCASRMHFNAPITAAHLRSNIEPTISTLPMPLMVEWTGITDAPAFLYKQITVKRWRVPGADVFQTIYFPSPDTQLYRASMTGDLLIAEYATGKDPDRFDFFQAFGLTAGDLQPLDRTTQRYGKIAPVDDAWRKQFIFLLSHTYNVYSLGRFATWRQGVLLDDLVHDIAIIKRLMTADTYDLARHHSQ